MLSCVVYNPSSEPLAVVRAERGLVLFLMGKAIVLEEYPGKKFRSPSVEFGVPKSVVLTSRKKAGAKYWNAAQLNQRNLFLRDGYRCAYCNRHVTELRRKEYLSRDHVVPLAQGGKDVWTNLVTCCNTCNRKKDDRTPEEAGFVLNYQPHTPTVFEILTKRSKKFRTAAVV